MDSKIKVSEYLSAKELPYREVMALVLSFILLLLIVIPHQMHKDKGSLEEALYVGSLVAKSTKSDVSKGLPLIPNVMLAASGRVYPGPHTKIYRELTKNNGILISSASYYVCVKLAITGPQFYQIASPNLC